MDELHQRLPEEMVRPAKWAVILLSHTRGNVTHLPRDYQLGKRLYFHGGRLQFPRVQRRNRTVLSQGLLRSGAAKMGKLNDKMGPRMSGLERLVVF